LWVKTCDDLMKRILIIEDDKKIVDIIRICLRDEGYEVVWTSSGSEGVSLALDGIDLVILDLMLPDLSGEEVCRRLRRESNVPIIMLSGKGTPEERIRGFGLGADDYVVKPFSLRELMLRVKAVLKRTDGHGEPPPVVESISFNKGLMIIKEEQHKVMVSGRPVDLTPVEFKALMALVKNRGLVLSRPQLIELVYGYSFEGYDRTVDAHIKNLRRKIEANTRKPIFIQTIYGVGYQFTGIKDDELPEE